jgi:hypothetical protein
MRASGEMAGRRIRVRPGTDHGIRTGAAAAMPSRSARRESVAPAEQAHVESFPVTAGKGIVHEPSIMNEGDEAEGAERIGTGEHGDVVRADRVGMPGVVRNCVCTVRAFSYSVTVATSEISMARRRKSGG